MLECKEKRAFSRGQLPEAANCHSSSQRLFLILLLFLFTQDSASCIWATNDSRNQPPSPVPATGFTKAAAAPAATAKATAKATATAAAATKCRSLAVAGCSTSIYRAPLASFCQAGLASSAAAATRSSRLGPSALQPFQIHPLL